MLQLLWACRTNKHAEEAEVAVKTADDGVVCAGGEMLRTEHR